MKKIAYMLLAVCVGVSALASSARAIPPSPPPGPWEFEFEEYGRIFFMTPADDEWEWEWERNVERYGEQRMQVHSGLYYNTDPLVNIYRVYEFFEPNFGVQVWFSSDGRYIVWLNMITNREMSHDVLRLFADGQRVASYTAGDLVRNQRSLQRFSTLYTWISSGELDQDLNVLFAQTVDGHDFTFDLTTGEIISQTGRLPSVTVIVVATGTVGALAAVIVLVRCRRRTLYN